jgi:hypothetical protein
MGDLNLPSQERLIGGTVYRVTMLQMGQWEELLVLVMRGGGKPVAEFLAGINAGNISSVIEEIREFGTITPEALASLLPRLASALCTLAETLDVTTIRRLRELLALSTFVDGSPLDMTRQQTYWARGHMAELVPYLGFALEVQLADFFGGLLPAAPPGEAAKSGVVGASRGT